MYVYSGDRVSKSAGGPGSPCVAKDDLDLPILLLPPTKYGD